MGVQPKSGVERAKADEVYLTIADVAKRWKSSERHVHRVVKSRELEAHRIGRLVRIALKDLLVFEARCASAVRS